MRKSAILCLLGACFALGGMTGDGCQQIGSGLPVDSDDPAIIIPVGVSEETFVRVFRVDLRKHPNTERISWDFGDGGVSPGLSLNDGREVRHTFVGAGTFTVTVHLFGPRDYVNNTGPQLIGTGSLPVTVVGPNRAPSADFLVTEIESVDGSPVNAGRRFDARLSRDPDGFIASYAWDFGDGTSGEGQLVDHSYESSGRYVVRLTVTDDRDAIATITRSVLINLPPSAQFDFDITGGNLLTVNFDASASADPDGTITQYRWNFGDDSVEGFGSTVSHTYAAPDDYTVTLTVTDDLGQSTSTSRVVEVNGIQPFVRSATPDLGEVGETALDVSIEGENFEPDATVLLQFGANTITPTAVAFDNASRLRATFDLQNAVRGDYDVIVNNPLGGTVTLSDGFRVVSPDLVRLTTSLGEIQIQLVPDAPITTENFLQYVVDDFYDGTIFHRVIPDFVVQGGSFLPGNVQQQPVRPPIQNEFSPLRSNIRGTLAMAKLPNNPDSATSGFFFNLADNSSNLDNQNGGFTVFANVTQGLEVVDAMAAVELNGEQPVVDIVLISAERE